jgi:hypothetical protein
MRDCKVRFRGVGFVVAYRYYRAQLLRVYGVYVRCVCVCVLLLLLLCFFVWGGWG